MDVATIFKLDFVPIGIFDFQKIDGDFVEVEIEGIKCPILKHWIEIQNSQGEWVGEKNPLVETAIRDFSSPTW